LTTDVIFGIPDALDDCSDVSTSTEQQLVENKKQTTRTDSLGFRVDQWLEIFRVVTFDKLDLDTEPLEEDFELVAAISAPIIAPMSGF
jgi:hypothetical protein